MSETDRREVTKPNKSEQQPDEVTEANKPDNTRAKGEPKAGNILGGMQSNLET